MSSQSFFLSPWQAPHVSPVIYRFLKKFVYIYVFSFGCAVCSLLLSGLLCLWRAGFLCMAARGLVIPVGSFAVEHSTRAGGLSCCGVWAQLP